MLVQAEIALSARTAYNIMARLRNDSLSSCMAAVVLGTMSGCIATASHHLDEENVGFCCFLYFIRNVDKSEMCGIKGSLRKKL